jgi:predicted amidophosphoribosyltransferase
MFRGETSIHPPFGPFDFVLSLFPYEGKIREGIRAAKYGGRSDAARSLARRLFTVIREDWAGRFPAGFRPTIVPVPIRPVKYFRRGYNFPALVALFLGRLTGWPCDPLLLRRTRERRAQAGLPLSAREGNVRSSFTVRPGAHIPCHVLLVDDVYTSGATVAACASALKIAGAEHIVVLTVARAIL